MNRNPSDELVKLTKLINELTVEHEKLFESEYDEKVEPIITKEPIKSIWFWIIIIPLSFITMTIDIALQGVE